MSAPFDHSPVHPPAHAPQRARTLGLLSKVLSVAVPAVVIAATLFLTRPSGTVFFTGLDDSAQCALARSIESGTPLVFRDEAFAAIPPAVRPALLYRPAAARKTHDLAHLIDPATCEARPFYQPFLAWQRARLPGLPALLGFAVAAALFFHLLYASIFLGVFHSRAAFAAVVALLLAETLLLPWPRHFARGPYAEGPATLFAALALCLAFLPPPRKDGRPGSFHLQLSLLGLAEGICLGLAVTFHPMLSAYALPIGVFTVLRTGRPRHTLALALGAAIGTAPLVWSTICVCAPYGNFLRPATLRAMVTHTPDIRLLAIALCAAIPAGVALLVAAHLPRLRAFAAKPRSRTAISILAALAVCAVCAVAMVHPLSRRALAADADALLAVWPVLASGAVLALLWRRPATAALLAGCAFAALPFLMVQGNEVHVGLWSLRRSLAPTTLCLLAVALGAGECLDEGIRHRTRAGLRLCWILLAGVCSIWQATRTWKSFSFLPAAASDQRLVERIEAELPSGSLVLFDHIPYCTAFAALPDRDVFGLNQDVSKTLRHGEVVDWLRAEAARRPVFVVASAAAKAPILEDGIALVPAAKPISETLRGLDGKTFTTARWTERMLTFTVLRVRLADPMESATVLDLSHVPFGLADAWEAPKRGRAGRWAADGAAFWGPVPKPGEEVEITLRASWWTRDGTNAPPQTLRIEPPFPGSAAEIRIGPSPDPATLRCVLARSAAADSASPDSATGLYRIRGTERYNEKGFRPDLVAEVFAISAAKK